MWPYVNGYCLADRKHRLALSLVPPLKHLPILLVFRAFPGMTDPPRSPRLPSITLLPLSTSNVPSDPRPLWGSFYSSVTVVHPSGKFGPRCFLSLW